MSNARAFLRLGYGACLLGAVACAQGVPSPGVENLTDNGDDGGSSGSLSASGAPSGISGSIGSLGSSGSTSRAGTSGVSGSANGGTSSVTAGGTSSGGTTSSAGSAAGGSTAGGSGSAGSGTAGSGVGGGTGPEGCSHPQPGDMGLVVKYADEAPQPTVPYIYFDIEIDNPDSNGVPISDLHLRYYFNNDLTTPVTDFYAPQVKHANGVTENLDANSLQATYTSTYLEVGFTTSLQLLQNESLAFKVHMHSDPNPSMHSQANDYSFGAMTTLAPWCNVVLNQQTAPAWGTPPP